jgi:opacity protein-like surface antigen
MKKLVIAALLLVALSATAQAADRPLFSLNRLSLSAGLDYAWYGAPVATSSRLPVYAKEWEAGLYGAYTIAAPSPGQDGPIVTLVGSSAYGLDNKLVRTKLGVRIGLKKAD